MIFLRSFFFNFLAVFFANRVVPGIEIGLFESLPNIGADILFSLIVGFLGASIFPLFMILEKIPSILKLAFISFFLSFGSYLFIAVVHFGVRVRTFGGGFLAGLIVGIAIFLTNYLEMKHSYRNSK